MYVLDRDGLRLLDPTLPARRPWTTSTPFVAHAIAVTQLLVDLTLAERAGDLELLNFDAEPRCWRRFRTRSGETVTLKPDADVTVAIGEFEYHAFIEVDLATESRPRIQAKSRLYHDYLESGAEQQKRGVTPRVLWLTTTTERCAAISDALSQVTRAMPAVFHAALLEQLVEGLTDEADW